MALGFSPLDTKVEGGEIMTDFEIISVVIMTISRRGGEKSLDFWGGWDYNKYIACGVSA